MSYWNHVAITIFAFFLEVGWVVAVLLVTQSATLRLVLVTGAMQLLGYFSTKLVIADDWTMLTGTVGAMVGAWIGMRLRPKESQTAGPRRMIGFQSSASSSDDATGASRSRRA